jgi:hypothetical protein
MKILCLMLVLATLQSFGQQVADTLFQYDIPKPRYAGEKGPLILLDEAHHNFHTTTGRFRPFVKLLRQDGYRVTGSTSPFSREVLKPARILVIANALHASNEEEWTLPTPSAFTDEEIEAVVSWVKSGGSLFLIADHMPFPGSSEKLAARFGFTFYNGFAFRKGGETGAGGALRVPDIFTPGNGLIEGPVTRGSVAGERVTSLRTFTGQAFDVPQDAKPIVVLDDRYELLMCRTAWQFNENTTTRPAAGLAQGASLEFGKGRLVVFGEAAMFSAQMQGNKTRMGMNAPDAKQNPQFLLNVIHWLEHAK